MKRVLALTLLIAVLAGGLGETASAKSYTIYGDGSKIVTTLKNNKGYTFNYYDIFAGQRSREDASDPTRFVKAILLEKPRINGVYDSQANAWDMLTRGPLFQATDLKLRNKSLFDMAQAMCQKFSYEQKNELTFCYSTGEAEQSIRKDYEDLMRSKVDRNFEKVYVNEDLKKINYSGPTYYTLNAVADPGSCTLGWGSVFYDIQFRYLEDGNVADSAAGKETDKEKLKGKRGFNYTQAPFVAAESMEVVNEAYITRLKAEKTMTTSRTVAIENTVNTTEQTSGEQKIGIDMKVSGKIPFIGETSLAMKTEQTNGWMSSTSKGSSKREEESQSVSDKISVEVPPRSVAVLELMAASTAASVEYDFPIAVTFKVAQYVILDHEATKLIALWGGTNSDHRYAVDNLRERYEHRNDRGYESVFGNGYPIKWNAVNYWDDNQPFKMLKQYIPMSITGGALAGSGKTVRARLREIRRIGSANLVQASGPASLTIGAGDALDLSSAKRTMVYDALSDDERAEYYDFNEYTDGRWIICDAQCNPVASDLAEINLSAGGHSVLKAGSKAGSLYVKYEPDGKELEYYDDGALSYTNVGAMENETLTKVNIVGALEHFTGTVSVQGPLYADLRIPFDLRLVPVKVISMASGELAGPEFPYQWQILGGNTADIAIQAGILTAEKSGEYQLQVAYGGVTSEPVKLIVAQGAAVDDLALSWNALVVNKNESAKLTATVSPANAANPALKWTSSDESVAKVDQTGKVSGVSTGFATIRATTEDGGFWDTCDVEVQMQNRGEGLNMGKVAMAKGALRMMKNPGNAKGVWAVEDKNVATVSGGRVKARRLGETVLTFRVSDAKDAELFMGKALKAGDVVTIPLAVRKPGAVVTSLSVSPKSQYLTPGESVNVVPTVKPAKAVDKEVFYMTSDKTVALVNDQGIVTAVDSGTATIYVTTCTGITKKVPVKVTRDVVGISVSPAKLTVGVAKSAWISAQAKPAGIAIEPHFASSNESIATVDQNGYVTGVKKGACKIYVYKGLGSSMKATVRVTVK